MEKETEKEKGMEMEKGPRRTSRSKTKFVLLFFFSL
jgi:hypothetical protein